MAEASPIETSSLPAIVLALQPDPAARGVLVASRSPGGAIGCGLDDWPRSGHEGTLFLYWPAGFRWPGPALDFVRSVRDGGGAVLSLTAVLRRAGLRPGRGIGGLLRALAPEMTDVEDPVRLGRLLLEALAERLQDLVAEGEAGGERYRPRPEITAAMEAAPEGPGIYAFLAADRRPLYVGKASSLRRRVHGHFAPEPGEPKKSRELSRRAIFLEWEETGSELEALLREQMRLSEERPPFNTQEKVHSRPRGVWRKACALLVLPSTGRGCVEVCVVAGDGRFHWERVRRKRLLPREFWGRVKSLLGEGRSGWAPGRPGDLLRESEAAALAEIALSWLARKGDAVSRIDLDGETVGRALMERIRRILSEDPARGRIEVR